MRISNVLKTENYRTGIPASAMRRRRGMAGCRSPAVIAVSNATGTAFVSSYAYDHLGRSMTTKPVVNWAEKPPIIEQKTVNEVKKKLKVKP